MTKQKAPKAQSDSLLWIEQALRDFGTTGVSIRDLIEFLKVGLKSTNAMVRTSATKTLVTLKLYVGAGTSFTILSLFSVRPLTGFVFTDITTFLQDLNPQLLTTIESEFNKVASDSPPEPTRTGVDNAVETNSSAGGKVKANAGDALDDLFPRVDLDKLLSPATISACNDANWKTRKEALETIQSILEANKRLKPCNLCVFFHHFCPDTVLIFQCRLCARQPI
jgi:cytoskeleton-associated protein 5